LFERIEELVGGRTIQCLVRTASRQTRKETESRYVSFTPQSSRTDLSFARSEKRARIAAKRQRARAAKLEQGCTIAVFLAGHFMLVGRIERRPLSHRRLMIRCRSVKGDEYVTRIYGLRDDDMQVWQVTGVFTPVTFADQ